MTPHDPGPETDLEVLASLAEPVRRALYDYVAVSPEPVSRDEAAEAVDVSRQVAAYHLDRLADDGLLEVEFRRLSGRTGPGAGRPSKLYSRAEGDHEVSVPPRRYELAARILLDAAREGHLDRGALTEAARKTGREIGRAGLEAALEATGYEPVTEKGQTRFRNCPFHLLRDRDRDTTCGLNLALVEGMVEASGADTDAVLAPEEGYCCVRLSPPVDEV
ncbi:MAG: helix-turn-helix domain-containing protein [Acidimicrobiia bacterium]